MILTRRRAVTLTISSFAYAAPWPLGSALAAGPPLQRALRNPRDADFLKAATDTTKEHVGGKAHAEGPKPPMAALDHSWKETKKDMPKGGCTLIIDKEGNWSFSALFDPYRPKLPPPCFGIGASLPPGCPKLGGLAARSKLTGSPVGRNGALIFALRSSLGEVMVWEAGGFIGRTGLSWQKQGNDPVVRDLWSRVVSGHKWLGVSVFSQIMLQSTSTGAGGGRKEGNSGLGAVAGVLGTVGAVIASLF